MAQAEKRTNKKGDNDQKRIEKEKERAAKQALAAAAKGMKKENWMEYMQVKIDESIIKYNGGTQMITTLQLEGLKCEIVSQSIPNTISFTRSELCAVDGVINKSEIEEDVILLVEQADRIGCLIQQGSLLSYIQRLSGALSHITLFVLGQEKLMKSKRMGAIKRLEWEEGLLKLQLDRNITTYCISDIPKLVDNVRMFCKALGERPHKIKANKDLFIGASKQTLFVDTQGGGYLQVFITQLQDIRSVNEAVASAVGQHFASPLILRNYIDKDMEAAVTFLADIPVRRGVGTLANVRRVGPEAAKRIALFYSTSDSEREIE